MRKAFKKNKEYSNASSVRRFYMNLKKPTTRNGCWLWQGGLNENGYSWFSPNKGDYQTLGHRFSYKVHKGPIPKHLQVNHKCDVRNCVNPEHLELGTQAENQRQMGDRGRSYFQKHPEISYGSRNNKAKLTEEEVLVIRERLKTEKASKLAKELGLTYLTIYRIGARKLWKHI